MCTIKNNLAALAMILGINSTIVGVDGSVAGVAGGDVGGPLYITGGEIGGSSKRT